jgi:hypothetical protein
METDSSAPVSFRSGRHTWSTVCISTCWPGEKHWNAAASNWPYGAFTAVLE